MNADIKKTIHDVGSEMSDVRPGQGVAVSITSAASALMLTLMGLNDTLEEIRDAIRGEK